MTNQDKLAEFLARKGATVCPPAKDFVSQATPLARGRRQHERYLIDRAFDSGDTIDHEVIERECGAEAAYLRIQGVR
jgi:hypothetical protein